MDESTAPEHDFDRLMTPAQQARWLVEPHWYDRDGRRPADDERRQRDAPRFERLRAMAVWPDVEDVLRRYVRAGVPAPRRSEAAFWACACLPDAEDALVLAALHVGARQVCAVSAEDALTFSFCFALSPSDVSRFTLRAGVDVADLRPQPDGDVDVVVRAVGREAATTVLDDEVVVRALRRTNLELARAGRCAEGDAHNLALADALLLEPALVPVLDPSAEAYRDPVPPPYLGPTKLGPDLQVDEALALVDRMIAARQHPLALRELEALHQRFESRRAQGEIVARFERLVGVPWVQGTVRYALVAIVTHYSDCGDDEAVFRWLEKAKESFVGAHESDLVALLSAVAGRAHRRAGRPARGIELLARGLAAFTDAHARNRLTAATFTVELGRCYTALGDFGAAEEHVRDALRAVGDEPHPLQLTARCALAERQLRAGEWLAARQSLETVLMQAHERRHGAVLVQLLAAVGWCDEKLDAVERSIEHYSQALEAMPADASVGLRRGVLAGLVRGHDRRGAPRVADVFLRQAEALHGTGWPGEEPRWPLDELIEACLALDPPAPVAPPIDDPDSST